MTFITMSSKEAGRFEIIMDLLGGKINGSEAAKQLRLSTRQTRRIKVRVNNIGIVGVVHQSRGRNSNHRIDDEVINQIKKLLREKYNTCKPTFISEKLWENHKIKISKEKVRFLMIEEKLWKVKPRKCAGKKRHTWRPRKTYYGEMQQFDGSYHIWFGNQESCLLVSIDDATGKITYAKFDINESKRAVFSFWLEYFDKNDLPLSVYLDKYSTYKVNHKNATFDPDMITQFERAMKQVGVTKITAHSPQAKGRVERLFGTLQDRLVQELKLANITTIDEANKFLKEYIPKFNDRFSVVPEGKKNLHKKIPKQIKEKLTQIFSVQDKRVIQNDYTVMHDTNFYQLNEIQPTTVYKKDKVIVETHLDGEIKICLRDKYLNFQKLPRRPQKIKDVPVPAITTHKSTWKPPSDHPWRRQFFINKIPKKKEQVRCKV